MQKQELNETLYKRPKQTEIMQGISDTIRLVNLELLKLNKFYGYYDYNSSLYSILNNAENQLIYWEQQIQVLRQKGL